MNIKGITHKQAACFLKYIPVLILLFCAAAAHAQSCDVNEFISSYNHPIRKQAAAAGTNQAAKGTQIFYIPLKFHVIYGDGVNANNWYHDDTTMLSRLIDTTNLVFRDAGIQFCKSGAIDFIHNDTFANIDHYSLFSRFYPTFNDTTVIHVLIPVKFGTANIVGYAFQGATLRYGYGGSGNVVAISQNMIPVNPYHDKYVLAHELGHYFGLYHTDYYSWQTGLELVNRTNCDTTGDYCCSTPAEYGSFFADSTCSVIRQYSSVDANGDTLMPDGKNIMCNNAWTANCWKYFTIDQITRIEYFHTHYLSHLVCSGQPNAVVTAGHTGNTVSIFPNPSGGRQTIVLNTAATKNLNLTLLDITGKIICKIFDGHLQEKKETIDYDLSKLTPGIYFYRFAFDDEVLFRKIVKQ